MKKTVAIPLATLLVAMLSGCAVSPSGPSVMALPGSGKSWDQFRFDDSECRSWAQSQIGGGGADQAATDATLRSVAVGTAVGALAGAAMGGERGAGTGAGTGLIVGTGARHSAHNQSRTGTRASATLATHGSTRQGPYRSTHSNAAQGGVGGRLIGTTSANLALRPAATFGIIKTKLIPTLATAWQGHDTGT